MLGPDARNLARIRCDEPRPAGACCHRGETRPAYAGTPQGGDLPVEHHLRTVAGAIEIDRLEIIVLLQPEAIEHIARQDRKPGAACPERDALADEIANRFVPAI